jgi:D-amino-acid dehydrogenase
MAVSADSALPIAVIGAGIIGMACARALQREGARVVVLDPNEPGSGCSFGNAGHIAIEQMRPLARGDILRRLPRMMRDPLGPLALKPAGLPALAPWMWHFGMACLPGRVRAGTELLAALLRAAPGAWAAEIAASGLGEFFCHRGALTLYETRAGLAAATAEARMLARYDLACEALAPGAVAELAPELAVPVEGGHLYREGAHVVDPHGVVLALARRFVAEGGTIERRRVTGFAIAGDEIRALKCAEGEIAVAGIVLAAGAQAGFLARALGVRAPLTRERGYHVMVDGAALAPRLPLAFSERGFVATPMAQGTRLAGTVELGAGEEPDWRRAEILLTHARALFAKPTLAATSRWFGNRPTLPDYRPMIGTPARARNAALALGHQHLGLTLAAITGRLVVECLLRSGLSEEWRACRPGRFG